MTELQRLQLRGSEIRSKLNTLSGVPELSDDQRTEIETLTNEYRDIEARSRAAMIAESDPLETAGDQPAPETRELDDLRERWDMGRFVQAVAEHRSIDGPERDYQQALDLEPNFLPVATLETRAAAMIPADVQGNQQPIIPQVFPQSVAAFLGVSMPTVPVGDAIYPVLTTGATVHTPEAGEAAAETTGAFTAYTLDPRRLQAGFRYRREDRARFGGLAESLTENLTDALGDALDAQVLNAASTADPATTAGAGLLNGGLGTAPTAPTDESGYADYRDAVIDLVDGRYANTEGDIRIALGAATFKHAHGAYRLGTDVGESESGIAALRRLAGGVRVSAHIAAPASDVQGAIAARNLNNTHMVAPIWEGIELVPDRVTAVGTGEIKITAVMLFNLQVVRAAGFERLAFKLA